MLIASAHRVAGGSHPPPAPTERSVRISRTTLFGEGFTAQRMPGTAGMAGPGVVAVAASSPLQGAGPRLDARQSGVAIHGLDSRALAHTELSLLFVRVPLS